MIFDNNIQLIYDLQF